MEKPRNSGAVNVPDPAAEAPSTPRELEATCPGPIEQLRETDLTLEHDRAASERPRPFIGRSRGVISATRDDLLAPLSADWEVGADL